MKIVIQRVKESSVSISGQLYSEIKQGLLVFVGIRNEDDQSDIDWLVNKLLNLRIFNDENGVMNLSVQQIEGEILIVSQFTLHASTKKGNRPSYIYSAKPDIAIPLYQKFIQTIEKQFNNKISTGDFGADMKVSLVNDGPVTIIIDSQNRE
ncbi:MAG: D-aminoacyl-tRNA deacylase [Bacteroidota bacterium]